VASIESDRAHHQENHLRRFHPAAILAAVTALIILLDAVVVVVPGALADPESSATPTASRSAEVVAAAEPTGFWFAEPTWKAASSENVYIPGPTILETPTPKPTTKPAPTPVPYRDTVWNARTYVKNRVGSNGYDCINVVWTHESGWDPYQIYPAGGNPATAAYGIPQAHPGSKMAAFGSNWRYSPLTQVKWGLWYVANRYGSACAAYTFWEANGWY
jgi:hypothetical protein